MKQVRSLFQPTDAVFWTLAIGSGIYTYLGARLLLDGESLFVYLAALVYATCVTLGIRIFWMWATRVLPETRSVSRLAFAWMAVVIGTIAIVGMSSWLNATALAGKAALDLHMRRALSAYEMTLDKAHRAALQARGLLPDLRSDANRYRDLEAREHSEGQTTGFKGEGTITLLYSQISSRLNKLGDDIETAITEIDDYRLEAADVLAAMRDVLHSTAPVNDRRHRFEELAVEMDGGLAQLLATTPAGTVHRTAQNLLQEIVPPPITGTNTVARKQRESMRGIHDAIEATAAKLTKAAKAIGLPALEIDRPQYVPMHVVDAVFQYSEEFLPSWIGAVAIDLLPLVILIFMIVAENNRLDQGTQNPAGHMSMDEVIAASQGLDQMVRNAENVRRFPREKAS